MAIVYDMTSGNIRSESNGIKDVTDYIDLPENSPALQEVCETPEDGTRDNAYLEHIRELLKKL